MKNSRLDGKTKHIYTGDNRKTEPFCGKQQAPKPYESMNMGGKTT